MASLELLVKLASFGTAGVCILAIFMFGKQIKDLPNDSPPWKVSLMKRYQNLCVISAIICFLAGSVNAYFNRNKIEAAQKEKVEETQRADRWQSQYEGEQKRIETVKAELDQKIDNISVELQQNPSVSQETRNSLSVLRNRTFELKMKPAEEMATPRDLDKRNLLRKP